MTINCLLSISRSRLIGTVHQPTYSVPPSAIMSASQQSPNTENDPSGPATSNEPVVPQPPTDGQVGPGRRPSTFDTADWADRFANHRNHGTVPTTFSPDSGASVATRRPSAWIPDSRTSDNSSLISQVPGSAVTKPTQSSDNDSSHTPDSKGK